LPSSRTVDVAGGAARAANPPKPFTNDGHTQDKKSQAATAHEMPPITRRPDIANQDVDCQPSKGSVR
jgi:hypothetical protein